MWNFFENVSQWKLVYLQIDCLSRFRVGWGGEVWVEGGPGVGIIANDTS